MKISLIIKDVLGNLPLRGVTNRTARKLRQKALSLLPSKPMVDASEVLHSSEHPNRWSNLGGACSGDSQVVAEKLNFESPRSAFVRKFSGQLRLDPASTHIFDGRRIVWGSTEGISRERDPSWASQFQFPRADVDAFLSLRGGFEYNYFHFFYDTLRAYFLAERYIDPALPVLVGEQLKRNAFFDDAVRHGIFGKRRILVQGKSQVVAARSIYTARAAHAERNDMFALCERFGAPQPPKREGRRIYLGRGRKAQNSRMVRNEAELIEALRRHGFESVDTQELSLEEQMKLFAETEQLVAPHGAGITNVIWRQGRPLKVIELINGNYFSVDFLYFCRLLGYDHSFIMNLGVHGRPLKSSSVADISAIEQALKS